MNYDLLKEILEENFNILPPNRYSTNFQGTLMLAKHHISKKKDCRSIKASKYAIKLLYKDKIFGSIYGQTPTSNKANAKKIAHNKIDTEKYLKQASIVTTQSIVFDEDQYNEAEDFIRNNPGDYVFKPFNLNGGRGISINVTIDSFDQAWNVAKIACDERKKEFKLIIQKYIKGIESRFLVIEGKFNSAILRSPANVVGNGINTINELIEMKNKQRELNPHLRVLPIKIDERILVNLLNQEKSLDSVLEKNEILYLHKSSNISLGGDSYEISDLINEDMIKVAEQAVNAIPGLRTAGVDMIYSSFEDKNPTVLELNPDANLRMHHYPFKGEPKEPVFDLIDAMLEEHIIKNSIS